MTSMPLTISIGAVAAAGSAEAGVALLIAMSQRRSARARKAGADASSTGNHDAPSSLLQSRFVSFFSSAYFAADALIIGPMIFMSDS